MGAIFRVNSLSISQNIIVDAMLIFQWLLKKSSPGDYIYEVFTDGLVIHTCQYTLLANRWDTQITLILLDLLIKDR